MKCHENVTKVINNFNSLSIRQTVKKKYTTRFQLLVIQIK